MSTTVLASKRTPSCVTAPTTRSPWRTRSSTACWNRVRFGWFSSRRRIAALYNCRSAWARVARTAGPLEALRMRNWMPDSSVAAAMAPPSASTSFTRWPLPMPPMDGLQDMAPRVSMLCVNSRVLAPARAEASAASVPAWPPPITITSKREGNSMGSGRQNVWRCQQKRGAIIRLRFEKLNALHVSCETSRGRSDLSRPVFHMKHQRNRSKATLASKAEVTPRKASRTKPAPCLRAR